MSPWILLLFSLCFIGVGDVLSKCWVSSSNIFYAIIAVLFYMCSTLCYLPLMKAKGLIIATLVWTIGTIMMGIVIGLSYGEHLTHLQIFGSILGVVSILLLCL